MTTAGIKQRPSLTACSGEELHLSSEVAAHSSPLVNNEEPMADDSPPLSAKNNYKKKYVQRVTKMPLLHACRMLPPNPRFSNPAPNVTKAPPRHRHSYEASYFPTTSPTNTSASPSFPWPRERSAGARYVPTKPIDPVFCAAARRNPCALRAPLHAKKITPDAISCLAD